MRGEAHQKELMQGLRVVLAVLQDGAVHALTIGISFQTVV